MSEADGGRRMNKNVERGQATRAHLVDVATQLFASHGYDGTSIEAVLAEAGVSRGSLYHHFAGKDALFWAVLEGVAARVGEQLTALERDAPDPVAALRVGYLGWVRLARGPGGPQRGREIDKQNVGWIKAALTYPADAGRIERRHVDVFAHIVLAAANEVALKVARAADPAAMLPDAESAFAEFLDRLLASPVGGQ